MWKYHSSKYDLVDRAFSRSNIGYDITTKYFGFAFSAGTSFPCIWHLAGCIGIDVFIDRFWFGNVPPTSAALNFDSLFLVILFAPLTNLVLAFVVLQITLAISFANFTFCTCGQTGSRLVCGWSFCIRYPHFTFSDTRFLAAFRCSCSLVIKTKFKFGHFNLIFLVRVFR